MALNLSAGIIVLKINFLIEAAVIAILRSKEPACRQAGQSIIFFERLPQADKFLGSRNDDHATILN
jgi:hypothetical protein